MTINASITAQMGMLNGMVWEGQSYYLLYSHSRLKYFRVMDRGINTSALLLHSSANSCVVRCVVLLARGSGSAWRFMLPSGCVARLHYVVLNEGYGEARLMHSPFQPAAAPTLSFDRCHSREFFAARCRIDWLGMKFRCFETRSSH